jgi:hypothetical protein
MPESTQIILGMLALLIVLILAMLGTGWWTKKICLAIMRELETKGAVNEAKAVALQYDKSEYFKIGYRDYRPKALEMLVISEAVCRTEDGRYYLNQEKAKAI